MNEFILALFQEHGKLKPSSLFHLLKGKRTTSILSFGFFHDLLHLNGMLPKYEQEAFWHTIDTLIAEGSLVARDEEVLITPSGIKAIQKLPTEFLEKVDYFTLGRRSEKMWRLVQFTVQVASNLGKTNHYLPLETSPEYTEKIRYLVRQYPDQLADRIFQELTVIFESMPAKAADYLAQTFTGHQVIGHAVYQLTPDNFREFPWSQLYHDSHTQYFFRLLQQHPDFLLYQLTAPYYLENENQSMHKTRELFLTGYSKEQIMKQRHLKAGTINDHLIEWALRDPRFPFSAFISSAALEKLVTLDGDYRNWDYREILAAYQIPFEEVRLYQIMRKREETHA